MRHLVIFLLIAFWGEIALGQQSYNNCSNALELCPLQNYSIDNINANVTFCPGCEDDFTFCFTPNNSIWLTFTTNATGGDVQLNFSNMAFQNAPGQDTELQATMLEAVIPCNATSYTQIGNCVNMTGGPFALSTTGLQPSTTYYVVISGDQTGAGITQAAEASMDVILSGPGVNRAAPFLNVGATFPFCEGTTNSISTQSVNCEDVGTFSWYVNGVLTAVTSDSSIYSSAWQDGDVVTVETTCFTLCPVTISQSIGPIPVTTFTIDAGPDVFLQPGESVILDGQTSATGFVWTPDYALSDPDVLSPVANPDQTTTYTLTATENGCVKTDYVTITVATELFFPNTFSPNGDGDNDTWVIPGIEKYPDCLLTIYDRWGQQVFQATGYSVTKAWNGEGKAGKLNEGVYFYEMQLRDPEKQIRKGSITLIR